MYPIGGPGREGLEQHGKAKQILLQFRSLREALIDASSIIYMKKAGYFERVSSGLVLYAPDKIIKETGDQNLPVQILVTKEAWGSADESLLQFGIGMKLPVITEDLEIIRQLKSRRIPYFNALMMLEFVYYKNLIGPAEYPEFLQMLLAHAWYGPEVVKFGRIVHQMLRKIG